MVGLIYSFSVTTVGSLDGPNFWNEFETEIHPDRNKSNWLETFVVRFCPRFPREEGGGRVGRGGSVPRLKPLPFLKYTNFKPNLHLFFFIPPEEQAKIGLPLSNTRWLSNQPAERISYFHSTTFNTTTPFRKFNAFGNLSKYVECLSLPS